MDIRAIVSYITSKSLTTLSIMVGASMASSVVGGLSGLVIARWVDPETQGLFKKFAIPVGYASVMLIPVVDGFTRQFPYLLGKGLRDEAMAIGGTAKCWHFGCACLGTVVFGGLSIRALLAGDWIAAVGWGAQVMTVLVSLYGGFVEAIYRRTAEFRQLSYNSLLGTIAGVVLLPFVYLFGFYGLAVRTVISSLTTYLANVRNAPMKIRTVWNKRCFFELVKISVPLSLIGYLRTSFLTASFNALLLFKCGQHALGVYAIAVTFQGFAMQFVNAIHQMLSVRVAYRYGECGSFRMVSKSLVVPTILSTLAAAVVAGCLCLVIGPFVRYVIPKYIDAIPLVWVLSLSLPLYAAAMPMLMLSTALKYRALYSIGILKVAVVLSVAWIAPRDPVGCVSALMCGELVDVVLVWVFLWGYCQKEKRDLSQQGEKSDFSR